MTDGNPTTDGGDAGARQPVVAGDFYADRPAALREQIDSCFDHEYGPGPLEAADVVAQPPEAVVVPHAGYSFSGPVAAHGFAALAERDPDVVVVFGPNHEGLGEAAAVATHDRWRTPFGTVPVDDGIADAVLDDSNVATADARTHAGEHSIEVQVPFIQYCLSDPAVVPVCLTRPGRERAVKLGRDVAGAVEDANRDVAVVASTDLTHYTDHETAVVADEPVVEAIADGDVDRVGAAVADGHTMCGPWSTIAALSAAEALGATAGERLQYATSGDTSGRRSRVVGYGAVALY